MSVLSEIRRWMISQDLDYFLASSTDEYLNEYIPLAQNSRYFLSGFSGSAGDVLVGRDDAFLFVDGRYHKQADDEVDSDLISVVKLALGQSQKDAIVDALPENTRLGLVSAKISYYAFCELRKVLPEGVELVEYADDEVEKLSGAYKSSKPQKLKQVKANISGLSADKKLELLQQTFSEDIFVVTKLDEIAYLTNYRGYNMAYSSCFKARAIIEKFGKCIIFTDEEIGNIGQNFDVQPENDFFEYLKEAQKTLVSTTSLSLKVYRALAHHQITEMQISPIAKMKSIKNKSELKHYKNCFEKTDKAVLKVQKWLCKKLKNGHYKTEQDISNKVGKCFRRYKTNGLSFNTIAATGANSAIVHYGTPSNVAVEAGMVLIDCGAYFSGGYATDITQTFFAGEAIVSAQHKQVYTAVLKGFLAGVNFPMKKGVTGQDIDNAVRKQVEKHFIEGFHFSHSTGHGVGIAVHEGPPFISSSQLGKATLEPGMCFTIEPGLYKDNVFGVRIERVVYVDNNYQLVPLSKLYFDDKLIDYDMLTEQEKQWVRRWGTLKIV